ncbi:MAG: glycoside hydrolase family 32 protein [Deltaproteobacteria bacterium]|nr:MAG: glycoside hydrolase family 32 protein [Deltaproteobacteria bacterium]
MRGREAAHPPGRRARAEGTDDRPAEAARPIGDAHPAVPSPPVKHVTTLMWVGALLAGCGAGVPNLAPSDAAAPAARHLRGWTSASHDEPFRPQLGYSPRRNWMNDPNGLIYVDGVWHLYYQHNPRGDQWGNMSWGHATSRDAVHWQEQPVALAEWLDPNEPLHAESVFSGCAVVDPLNRSGLAGGAPTPIFAFYTAAYSWLVPTRGRQAQSLAISRDGGASFERYPHNPLVALPPRNPEHLNGDEFRDPKVLWHAPTGRWVMLVTLSEGRQVRFYTSADLLTWVHASDFGPANTYAGIWEVPDLVEVPVEGHPGERRWVLFVSVNGGTPWGGSGVQYFVGDFDGERFVTEDRWTPGGPGAVVFEDFESGYGAWTVEGDAFGDAPATGALPAPPGTRPQRPVRGFEGARVVNTFVGGDAAVGVATSRPFTIDHDYVQLLVGGGRAAPPADDGEDDGGAPDLGVVLRVDGAVVRSASGDRSETLAWHAWDVRELRGREATLQIVDRSAAPDGHVLVDHILFSDAPLPEPAARARWVDWGMDFYAPTTFFGAPGERPVWLGWVSNWLYAGATPTRGFRGAQSFVRALSLRPRLTGGGWDLTQAPVGLDALRLPGHLGWGEPRRLDDTRLALPHAFEAGTLLEVTAEVTPEGAERVGVDVRFGRDDVVRVFYDVAGARLAVDRREAGVVDLSKRFAGVHAAPLALDGGRVRVRFFVDWSVLTVFGGDGRAVVTDRIFPDPTGDLTLTAWAEGGPARFEALDVRRLRSIWADDPAPAGQSGAPGGDRSSTSIRP